MTGRVEMMEIDEHFETPTDHPFEQEFQEAVPRPFVSLVRESDYAGCVSRRVISCAIASVVCLAVHIVAPRLGWYPQFVPYGAMLWISGAAALAVLIQIAYFMAGGGDLRYVRQGIPLAGMVRSVAMDNAGAWPGLGRRNAFFADVNLQHPETGRPMVARIRSRSFFQWARANYVCMLSAGTSVSLVYLPGRFEKSLRVFGFLGLDPEVSFVKHKDPYAITAWATIGAAALLLTLTYLGICAAYQPLARPLVPTVLIPIILGASLALAWQLYGWFAWSKSMDTEESHGSHAHMSIGALALGAMIPYALISLLNGPLDSSEPKSVRISLHNWPYEVKSVSGQPTGIYFSLAGDPEQYYRVFLAEELQAIGNDSQAMALVREGRFGWPWLEAVVPRPDTPIGTGNLN